MPSVWPYLAGMAGNVLGALCSLIGLVIEGNPLGTPLLIINVIGIFMWQRFYKNALATRRTRRKEKFEAWLNKPVPKLADQEPWPEIERAMEALLREDIDPTYERAVRWLERDRKQQTRQKLLDDLDRSAESGNLLAQSQMESIKAVYRVPTNAFACEHRNLEMFYADNSENLSWVCSDCGVIGQIVRDRYGVRFQSQVRR